MKSTIATALALPLLASSPAIASEWGIDGSHSSAQFSVRHMMVSNVRGVFGKLSGKLLLDEEDITRSSVEATIEVDSIDTRDRARDEHLKGADFFDVQKFPTMTFKSKKINKVGEGALEVRGDLTIRGVTREVVLAVSGLGAEMKDPWGNVKRGASATTTINRKDFGLTWNKVLETGGVLVGEEVAITIDVELNKKAAPAVGAK
ncbi:MAG: YceI family protein [Myxococcales bacterium]|jgi:polyisoprenoid-binding protein YceI